MTHQCSTIYMAELASFIFESGTIVANDSGNGHLAPFLGVPSITICRKRNPYFFGGPIGARVRWFVPESYYPAPMAQFFDHSS